MGVRSNSNKAYMRWKSMMQRCYKEHFHVHHPNYVKCTVHEDWHTFENFEKWYNENYIDGYFLDKDILVKGNTVYSENTCCFVPREINSIYAVRTKSKHVGVKIRKNNRFQARLLFNGKYKSLGTFGSMKEAQEAYAIGKKKCVKILAEKYKNSIPSKVYQVMLNFEL